MKLQSVKAILSSLLLLTFIFLAVSGAMLYFGKAGMIFGIARHMIRNAHAWTAFAMCALLLAHIGLNRRVFLSELRALAGLRSRKTDA
jgi:hypothetical protein